jgi:hypothetical protein
MMLKMSLIVLLMGSFFLEGAWSDAASSDASSKNKNPPLRQKVIDFEGDLVEGVNKRPLDSLSEISEAQKRKRKIHLYRKRKGFRTEIRETVREMRYLQ